MGGEDSMLVIENLPRSRGKAGVARGFGRPRPLLMEAADS